MAVKHFVPLENNPEVMTAMMQKLGLSKTLQYHDVFSIDEPELLAFIPRPCLALLLVFPVNESYEKFRRDEDADKPIYTGKGADEPVVWFKQTIRNACGLYGLLHGVSNGAARDMIETNSELAKLVEAAVPLDPAQRSQLLEESDALESAHHESAQLGDSTAPQATDDIDLHYVCFIKSHDNHVWELDGRRKGPLDRGVVRAERDVLSDEALDLGPRAFLKREQAAGGGELRFSLVALAPSLDY